MAIQLGTKASPYYYRQRGDRLGVAGSLHDLGVVIHEQGDPAAARALYEEALASARALADPISIAAALNNLGDLAREQGDYRAAGRLFAECLVIMQELGHRLGIAFALEGSASIAAGCGRPADAARQWGAADKLRQELGSPLPPRGRLRLERQVSAARRPCGRRRLRPRLGGGPGYDPGAGRSPRPRRQIAPAPARPAPVS